MPDEQRKGTKVTCTDPETGRTDSVVIVDDYVLIVDGSCYRDSVDANLGTGTHTLVVKGRRQVEMRGG